MPNTPLFSFAQYQLGSTIAGLVGLVEFSQMEYRAIQSSLPNERMFKAPPVDFLGVSWQVDLGCLEGQIYKIAPHWESGNSAEAADLLRRVYEYCLNQWGVHTKSVQSMKLWKTSWGNAVVQTYQMGELSGISLFFTSGTVLRSQLPARSYRFGKWFGYFQVAAGVFTVVAPGLTILMFPLNVLGTVGIFAVKIWRATLGIAAIAVGYGLVSRKKWGLRTITGLYGLAAIIAIASLVMAFQTAGKWNGMYTDASKQAFQQVRQDWLRTHYDPRLLSLTPEQRREFTEYYFGLKVKGNPVLGDVLASNPTLEPAIRQILFDDQQQEGSKQFSSGDLTGCVVHLGFEHLDTCISQYEGYYAVQLLFTLAFGGPVLAYYWKRRQGFV